MTKDEATTLLREWYSAHRTSGLYIEDERTRQKTLTNIGRKHRETLMRYEQADAVKAIEREMSRPKKTQAFSNVLGMLSQRSFDENPSMGWLDGCLDGTVVKRGPLLGLVSGGEVWVVAKSRSNKIPFWARHLEVDTPWDFAPPDLAQKQKELWRAMTTNQQIQGGFYNRRLAMSCGFAEETCEEWVEIPYNAPPKPDESTSRLYPQLANADSSSKRTSEEPKSLADSLVPGVKSKEAEWSPPQLTDEELEDIPF